MNLLGLVPLKWRFQTRLAVRHQMTRGGQTVLTIGAVAAGVIIIVFLTALFFGIRRRLTTTLTESIPHVTIRVRELEPVPLSEIQDQQSMSSSRGEKQAPQLVIVQPGNVTAGQAVRVRG
jgi:ABC-type lipoprotein release transport system permease subunit